MHLAFYSFGMLYTFKRHIAVFLFLVLSFFIVPKEFIHSLFAHEDTVCNVLQQSGPVLDSKHLHCEILNLNIPLYLFIDQTFLPGVSYKILAPFSFDLINIIFSKILASSLRAPPVLY